MIQTIQVTAKFILLHFITQQPQQPDVLLAILQP
jgi:hypothetical protein